MDSAVYSPRETASAPDPHDNDLDESESVHDFARLVVVTELLLGVKEVKGSQDQLGLPPGILG